MLTRLVNFLLDEPYPLRALVKKFVQLFGTYEQALKLGVSRLPGYGYPNYAYCIYQAAILAKKLGYKKISLLEFGVAAGNGLHAMEYHASQISKLTGVDFEIYGFDTSEGLPKPFDYRDLPYHWSEGFFKMDVSGLQARLKKAKLVLGNIDMTSKTFFNDFNPAPIGAIIYDFDFYSSTTVALKMLEAEEKFFLPRIFCYFDNTTGSETELFNDYTGERLAINEFNLAHPHIKLSLPYHLLGRRILEPWFHRIWIGHFFKHSKYNNFISQGMP
jgi:hypothetical protein